MTTRDQRVSTPWDLVTQAQTGDTTAYAQLYEAYAREVNRFVYDRLPDHHLAEDLTQETFLRGFQGIAAVTDQGKDIGAWLTTIAGNAVRDHVKSAAYQREHFAADVKSRMLRDHTKPDTALPDSNVMDRTADRHATPEDVVVDADEDRARTALVDQAAAGLTGAQRDALTARNQGISARETGAATGRSEEAVRALRYRAQRNLTAAVERAQRSPQDAVRERVARDFAVDPGVVIAGIERVRGPAQREYLRRHYIEGPSAVRGPVSDYGRQLRHRALTSLREVINADTERTETTVEQSDKGTESNPWEAHEVEPEPAYGNDIGQLRYDRPWERGEIRTTAYVDDDARRDQLAQWHDDDQAAAPTADTDVAG